MLKLHKFPESSRREAPQSVGRDFPLIVSRGLPLPVPMVRPKTDPRDAGVLNLLTTRSAKHRDRVFTGEAITGFGDLRW